VSSEEATRDRLKARVQLAGGDGGVLWGESFDRALTEVFAVQEDVAQSVRRLT
jgi:TolB-like protein